MKTLHARVEGGRVVVDESVDFPDGTELRLVVADEVEVLAPEERERLHAALEAAWRSVQEGRVEPIDGLLQELRTRG